MRNLFMLILLLSLWAPVTAGAGEAAIVKVKVYRGAAGTFSFEVTLKHGDTGWEHYADRWDVRTPGGKTLGTRTLYHPHVHEQPFTRDLSGVEIPKGMSTVVIRAHDKVHGFSEKTVTVALPGR